VAVWSPYTHGLTWPQNRLEARSQERLAVLVRPHLHPDEAIVAILSGLYQLPTWLARFAPEALAVTNQRLFVLRQGSKILLRSMKILGISPRDSLEVEWDRLARFTALKSERALREIPIPAFAVERLRRHKAAQNERRLQIGTGWHDLDLVCARGDGLPFDPDAFSHGFARIARSVGLAGVRLHDLRHAVATMLAKSTPAYVTSKLLGHSSVHFTANTYQHADEESVERALAGLEKAFRDS
jgi:Phage integrase family